MPIYEYQCSKCGLMTERFFKTIVEGEDYLPVCACENIMERIISMNSFSLKGDGWESKQKIGDNNG